jgi:hypothetical protein
MAVQYGSSYVVSYASNGTPIAAASRSITAGAAAGEALVMDMFKFAGPAGELGVTVGRTAAAAGIASALARVMPYVGAGMLAYDIYKAVGVRQGANGAEIDPGSSPSSSQLTEYQADTAGWAPNSVSACNLYEVTQRQFYGEYSYFEQGIEYYKRLIGRSHVETIGGRDKCVIDLAKLSGPDASTFLYPGFRVVDINSRQSAASSRCIEAATGAQAAPRSDGLCPTGRYESATESQVQAKLLPVAQANTVDAMKAAIAAGAAIPATEPKVAGPASQIGQPRTTTTTGPAGQTQTTTTPTFQYNYAGNTITYNTTNQTTSNVTNNAGDTSTTTTTEPVPSDTKQLCDSYPDSLACMKPGTAPDPEAVPIRKTPVSITSDRSRWGANAGGCTRAAIHLVSGPVIDLWKPFCDFFALIRGVVVGTFGLVGAFLFKNGVK